LEFEQLQAQLLTLSPLPSLVEAVTLAQDEEIHLRGVMSSSSTVLAALTASLAPAPTISAPTTVPLAPGGAVADVFCRYCKVTTHTIEKCRRRHPRRHGGAPTPTTTTSSQSPPDWALDLTQRMERLCASSSVSSVVSSVAARVPPPGPSSGASSSGTVVPWILDSGASFPMTHDSTSLVP
jgi:hypothetical protein